MKWSRIKACILGPFVLAFFVPQSGLVEKEPMAFDAWLDLEERAGALTVIPFAKAVAKAGLKVEYDLRVVSRTAGSAGDVRQAGGARIGLEASRLSSIRMSLREGEEVKVILRVDGPEGDRYEEQQAVTKTDDGLRKVGGGSGSDGACP